MQDLKGDVLKVVVLQLRVGLKDAPNGQNVTTRYIEVRVLVEPPAISLSRSEPAAVCDATKIAHELPVCAGELSARFYDSLTSLDVPCDL